MSDISPRRLEAAMSAAMQVKAQLPDDEDTALLLGMLEGETEALELLDRLAESAIADKLLAERAAERAKRIEQRADRSREIILRMLEALELNKLERPVFTASISHHRKALITDQTLLPEAFIRHSPDMVLIRKALRDGAVPGAEQSNPEPRLTLRSA